MPESRHDRPTRDAARQNGNLSSARRKVLPTDPPDAPLLGRATVLFCSLHGCLASCERGSDGLPVSKQWSTWTSADGCQRRHFCSDSHYGRWRQQQPGYTPPKVAQSAPAMMSRFTSKPLDEVQGYRKRPRSTTRRRDVSQGSAPA
jgi:hypothetical protein